MIHVYTHPIMVNIIAYIAVSVTQDIGESKRLFLSY